MERLKEYGGEQNRWRRKYGKKKKLMNKYFCKCVLSTRKLVVVVEGFAGHCEVITVIHS